MSEINLDELTLDELKALRKDVEKAISSYEKRKKQEALAKAEAAAREAGFSLSELMGDPSTRKGTINPPKYRHPENPETTWSGRGRQPAWIKEGLNDGKSLEDFLIK
ncbi:H-NS histone family protein [Palleronia pelagia]|uniref:DNA-binding protein H-NS n=1 Tax=Palleronia pelagia TaxID=387096 RepID=A0A1H8KBS2_9RHOB|nr:H-NS histone family protein [Palleronia pelagia]SEN90452.1 DNA-binding protein H-NS [Palleronia pelagia]